MRIADNDFGDLEIGASDDILGTGDELLTDDNDDFNIPESDLLEPITGDDEEELKFDTAGFDLTDRTRSAVATIPTTMPDNIVERSATIQRLRNQLRDAPTTVLAGDDGNSITLT